MVTDPLAEARSALKAFAEGRSGYVSNCLPGDALQLEDRAVLDALARRLGPRRLGAILADDVQVHSPVKEHVDGRWLQHTQTVGINVRTVQDFWGALKFVLTLPPHVGAVHLLPVCEPGVVSSLYGMASWRINAEFFSPAWARLVPELHSVERQLKVFVALCHVLGKTVGLDVIPHVDRFSEIVLCRPAHFEWIRRDDLQILDQRSRLHEEVEQLILGWLTGRSTRQAAERSFRRPSQLICHELFGSGTARQRNERRDELISFLHRYGYETLPATMGPPYRGLQLLPGDENVTTDDRGRRWREYGFTDPGPMARVFGPLTRYKLYDRLDDNRRWRIDHDSPRWAVWEYLADCYEELVGAFDFDFMRGDMSHVQTRPGGVPKHSVEPYDPLRFVLRRCRQQRAYFAYFAESFLAPDDYMTYGSEAEHLERSNADVALGNLQSFSPESPAFWSDLADYMSLAQQRSFRPAFTVMTADKDDPRFDANFRHGSVARYFFACFCPALPSYWSLGFRQRELHLSPAPNEFYTKLYVFHYDRGPKATEGPYRWGNNRERWTACRRIDGFRQNMQTAPSEDFVWLRRPERASPSRLVAWQWGELCFAVNFGVWFEQLSLTAYTDPLDPVFVTRPDAFSVDTQMLAPGAGLVFWAEA